MNGYLTTPIIRTKYYNNPPVIYPYTNFFTSIPLPEIVTSHSYQNLDVDPEVHKRMIKYFTKKIYKWLNGDLKHILTKIKINNVTSDAQKIEHILKNVMQKSAVYAILDSYVKETGTKWYDLPSHKSLLMQVFESQILSRTNN